MYEDNGSTSGRKIEVLPLQQYRDAFAAVATTDELRLFEQQLAEGNKIGPIKLLRCYADKLDI